MQEQTIVIETKIKDENLYSQLDDYGKFYSFLERRLFNDLTHKDVVDNAFKNQLKREYIAKYQIPARLYNALFSDVDLKQL